MFNGISLRKDFRIFNKTPYTYICRTTVEAQVRLRNQFAEATIYSCSLKMHGRFVLPVEAKMREDRRRLVASCTNLRLNLHQPLLYPGNLKEFWCCILEALCVYTELVGLEESLTCIYLERSVRFQE